MKHYLLIILPIILFASCVKDRLAPATNSTGTGTTTGVNDSTVTAQGDSLMYYWNFNGADSGNRSADYIRTGLSTATFNYTSAYIDYTTGSSINIQMNADSGKCLRVRNPSTSIVFSLPTTGYKNIKFQFAEQRSSSGPAQNAIYYTVDGTTYISTALSNNAYLIDTTFGLKAFDLSSDSLINNNPKFAVKIVFSNNNTGTSGNDRFDNVSLFGIKQ